MDLQRPRGTRDFGPAEMARRRSAEEAMRDVFARFGFQEVQTPTFEHLELFTAKSGPGIVSELYDFKDKGERHFTLRPELTAPVMRFYFQELAMEPKPLKLFYFGNCFRYDRPQKGRYREFWQMGCELIGPDTPEAVGEVVALGVTLLTDAGIKGLEARVGHLGILRGLLQHIGYPQAAERGPLMRAVDKWDEAAIVRELEAGDVPRDRIDWFLGVKAIEDLGALRDLLGTGCGGDPEGTQAALEALDALVDTLDAAAAFGAAPDVFRPDPMIARGLDYYTGVVFEMDAPALGAEKQLLGGGVYDLSGVFGGDTVGTIGFGLGFDRTLVALEAEGAEAPGVEGLDVYVAPIGDAPRTRAIRLVHELRAAGLRAEVDLMRRNPGKNFKHAANRGAAYTAVLGERELEAGTIGVKDLATGDQVSMPLDQAVDWLVTHCGAGVAPEA